MPTFKDLALSTPRDLEPILAGAAAPEMDSLAGWEFDGANVGFWPSVPFTITLLGIGVRKFRKGFYAFGPDRDPGGPGPFIQGYNCLVKQDGRDWIDKPWTLLPSAENPKRFGYYRVYKPAPGTREAKYPNALFLDYGRGANAGTPRFLRDYLVQPDPKNPDVLLGKAYVALGPIWFVGGFFVLRRAARHEFKGEPVRALPAAQ